MEYSIKGSWKVKELTPLPKTPTCRVFKVIIGEIPQISCEYDPFHYLEVTLKVYRNSLTLKENDILLTKTEESLGKIVQFIITEGKVLIITEKE